MAAVKPAYRTSELWIVIGVAVVLVFVGVVGMWRREQSVSAVVSVGLPVLAGYYAKLRTTIKAATTYHNVVGNVVGNVSAEHVITAVRSAVVQLTKGLGASMATTPTTAQVIEQGIAPLAVPEAENVLPTLVGEALKAVGVTDAVAVSYFQAAAMNAFKGGVVLLATKLGITVQP